MVGEVSAVLSRREMNIATMQLYRDRRGGLAVMVLECDQPVPAGGLRRAARARRASHSVTYLNLEGDDDMGFASVEALLAAAQSVPLWEAVLLSDVAGPGRRPGRARCSKMTRHWDAMVQAVADYDPGLRSASGLAGGDGGRDGRRAPRSCCGAYVPGGDCHGPEDRRVQRLYAPDCGRAHRRGQRRAPGGAASLPGAARRIRRGYVRALYVAAGFGQVIATRASISGAEGGCQAEVGSASGMAAAALIGAAGRQPGADAPPPAP